MREIIVGLCGAIALQALMLVFITEFEIIHQGGLMAGASMFGWMVAIWAYRMFKH